MLEYKEVIDWMFAQLPMYQRQGKTAFKKSLDNIIAFAEYLDNPQNKFKSIHVGGTNGKGSTSHLLASVMQDAGYTVGLYTSPHLKSFTERIRINGIEVSENWVTQFINKNKLFLETQRLSFFEMTVGMAFQYFAEIKVDVAIIEVGLGGRLDSTNIINPLLSIITNIGLDHTQMLGDTLEQIAFEKAGIIKSNTPVVIGEEQIETKSIFIDKAKSCNASISFASKEVKEALQTDLKGDYQIHNVKTVLQACSIINKNEWFKISEENIKNGLLSVVTNTNLKGRWQVLNDEPLVICDTAHNTEGLSQVMKQLKNQDYKHLHLVLGVVNDKNLANILPHFPKNGTYYFCKPNIPRGLESVKLQEEAYKFGLKGDAYNSVNQAYNYAFNNASKNDLIYVGGSTFVVAEII